MVPEGVISTNEIALAAEPKVVVPSPNLFTTKLPLVNPETIIFPDT